MDSNIIEINEYLKIKTLYVNYIPNEILFDNLNEES